MSFEPLIRATGAIPFHAFAAMAAFVLAMVQFAAPKGTLPHRTLGWVWVALMASVALSSFWVHTICQLGGFSVIHLLSVFVLIMLPRGVLRARRHQVKAHASTMKGLFLGALLIAGLFTFMPGRIMHSVVFGTAVNHGTCNAG
jgi:uncharacterized membrane protein